MAQSSAARKLDAVSPDVSRRPGFDGGKTPPPVRPTTPIGSNAWLGMVMLLGAEAMFFAGLIGAFLVFRLTSPMWPPPFQPRLPSLVTALNTLVLMASAVTVRLGVRANRLGRGKPVARWLSYTAGLGAVFLAIQGFEWVRLIHFGLTVSSSVYGALFYTIIGCHALHVLGALIWLVIVWLQAEFGKVIRQNHVGLQICAMYWVFVVALWPALYALVYLL
jgi:heme/copper-type cytochrome/quinol oxidase subunit 3